MSTRALIIRPDGTARVAQVDATLDPLQAVIGGMLEYVSLALGHLYCDEEGKLKGSPPNRVATRLAHKLGWAPGDLLCGTVIFLDDDEEGGEADVPQSVIDLANTITEVQWPRP